MVKKKEYIIKSLNKSAIIEEYLTGNETFKELGEKYGIPARTIQSWVRSYRKNQNELPQDGRSCNNDELKAEIERLKLKNELLEEILNLSEKQTGISLRKKFGPKQ